MKGMYVCVWLPDGMHRIDNVIQVTRDAFGNVFVKYKKPSVCQGTVEEEIEKDTPFGVYVHNEE